MIESLSFVARAKEVSAKFERREGRVVAWTRALLVPPLNSENIYIHTRVDAHARGSRRGEDRSAGALYTCEPRQFVVTCLECTHGFRGTVQSVS